ncbi:helix-turn-helix domain-containing protein [Actinokineospora iranica]|uniref:PucR C-terminal helix-turn-helix domain-containing protein n=1 Tax=Actinokineospora iranica TaxID=1271860 RepID=A0A1G6LG96_9PSEU|nr:helix-turn-helix domain-containing protein [Actinokineospora iranica]SDC42270.1 PucR C-terminal helix-turn-helix domain-containing protein [Actinokineospora iranica]
MNLRMLLDHPDLDLDVLVPPENPDRPIRYVYTTDLVDPSRYLSGGELVLTGLVWWSEPGQAEPFVAALAAAGVAALGAGAAEHHEIPDDVVRACERHGVPLFGVPAHVSFAALTEYVVLGAARVRARAGVGVPDLRAAVANASTALDAGVWVLSPTGRVVAGTTSVPPIGVRQLLARRFLDATRLPVTVRGPGHPPHTVAEGSVTGTRALDWFLAAPGDQARWSSHQRHLMDILAVAAANEQSATVPARPDLSLLSSEDLRAAGLGDPDGMCVVSASADRATPDVAAAVLAELAASLGVVSVLGKATGPADSAASAGSAGEVRAVWGVGRNRRDRVLDELVGLVRLLEPGFGDVRFALGVGGSVGPAGLSASLDQARNARRVAERRGCRAGVQDGARLGAFHTLLVMVPDDQRAAFRRWVLGPVTDYDAEHQSDLLRTLRVFLACSGSWTKAAEQLHVHVNTLRYRIGRVEELTGRDLSSLPAQVDLHLALELGPAADT